MTRTITALFALALLVPVAAQAATPQSIAKRAAIAKAKAVTGSSTATIKDMRRIATKPNMKWEVGAKAGDCTVFMKVTVIRKKARVVTVDKDCRGPAPTTAPPTA